MISDATLKRLREQFIRPTHECTDEYQYAKSIAGTDEDPFWCFRCRLHSVVNNVCLECGEDERAKYGDFERDMTAEEWALIAPSIRIARAPRNTRPATEERRDYWRKKQRESRQARAALQPKAETEGEQEK